MLEDKIYNDYVGALKNRDKHKTQFLSYIRAGLKNVAISLKKEKLEDNEVLTALKKEQKRLEETKENALILAKQEIIEQAEREIAVLAGYLPKLLSDNELEKMVEQVIAETGAVCPKDMGKVMKELVSRIGMQADAKKMSELVKNKLGK